MRSKNQLWTAIACTMLCIPTVSAQMTMKSFVAEVLSDNPSIAATEAGVARAEARVASSGAWDPPMLKASFMVIPLSDINAFSASKDKRISIEQRIPFPGKTAFATDEATADMHLAMADEQERRIYLRAHAKAAYIRASEQMEKLSILRSQYELLEEMIASVESRYAVGRSSQSDVLRLRIQLHQLANMIQTFKTDLKTIHYSMNALRGKGPETDLGSLHLVRPLLPALSVDSLSALAFSIRPDIGRVRAMRTSFEARAALARRSYWPDITLGGGYRNSQLLGNSWEVAIGFSLPIAPWSSQKINGRSEEAEAGIMQTDALLSDRTQTIRQEIATALQAVSLHHDRLMRYTNDMLPDALQSLESLRTAYLTDRTDFISFIDAFRTFETLQLESINERIMFLTSLARLEQVVGTELASPSLEERP